MGLFQELEKDQESQARLKSLSEEIKSLEEKAAKGESGQRETSGKVKELQKRISNLEVKRAKEKASYYYNLAVAYTKAKLHDKAIKAYSKSVEINPNNSEAHYNLGLLYEKVKNKPEEAVVHYKKYLKIQPQAKDKEEVMEWIKKLEIGGRQWKERRF